MDALFKDAFGIHTFMSIIAIFHINALPHLRFRCTSSRSVFLPPKCLFGVMPGSEKNRLYIVAGYCDAGLTFHLFLVSFDAFGGRRSSWSDGVLRQCWRWTFTVE